MSFILKEYSSINSNSSKSHKPKLRICSELIWGSPSSSDFKQYSISVSDNCVPSFTPNFLDKEPAKKFLTKTSIGIISTFFKSWDFLSIFFIKCVGISQWFNIWNK